MCWELTAQSTQWGHVERGQFTKPHVYWAGLVLLVVNQYCVHSFARNWQLPFLNQQKGENDSRKYFMINLHERILPTSAGVEPVTSWSPVGWRIQLSHRGWLCSNNNLLYSHYHSEGVWPVLFTWHKVSFRLNELPHTIYIFKDSNFNFRYVRLCDLDIPRERWLNYL